MMSPDEIPKDARRLKASLQIDTPRLRLSQPTVRDAEAVFDRYANDPDVTRFVGWPLHQLVTAGGVSKSRARPAAERPSLRRCSGFVDESLTRDNSR
jgi:RimJ/RimL family protein N-acetyltransferase